MEPLLTAYLAQLNPREREAYRIARERLGSTFDLSRSKGFLKWLKAQK
jgi:hypothetical protein